jgi:hypothetical protein
MAKQAKAVESHLVVYFPIEFSNLCFYIFTVVTSLSYIRKAIIYNPVTLVRPDANLAAVEAVYDVVDAVVPSNASIFKKKIPTFRYIVSGRSVGTKREPTSIPDVVT